MSQVPEPLHGIRDKIDSLDDQIQELLNERAALAAAVATAKAGESVKIRPAREAQILRRLVKRNTGEFPKLNLIRIWREIFSAMLRLEGGFSLAVFQSSETVGYWDLARDQFGTYTPITPYQTPRRVIEAIMRGEATVGIVPLPFGAPAEGQDWWRSLALGHTGLAGKPFPQIIGKLPFAGPSNARSRGVQAMVVARLEPEPSGEDRSWLILETTDDLSTKRLFEQLEEVGIDGQFIDKYYELGPPELWSHLIDVEGYLEPGDTRLDRLAEALSDSYSQSWVIGAYATPLGTPEPDPGAASGSS